MTHSRAFLKRMHNTSIHKPCAMGSAHCTRAGPTLNSSSYDRATFPNPGHIQSPWSCKDCVGATHHAWARWPLQSLITHSHLERPPPIKRLVLTGVVETDLRKEQKKRYWCSSSSGTIRLAASPSRLGGRCYVDRDHPSHSLENPKAWFEPHLAQIVWRRSTTPGGALPRSSCVWRRDPMLLLLSLHEA